MAFGRNLAGASLSARQNSTMLRLYNQGDVGTAIFVYDGKTMVRYTGAAGEFIKWDYADGKPMRRLPNRRIREGNVYSRDLSGLGVPPTFL
jgi:hypothetical protein